MALPWVLLALVELGLRVAGFGGSYPLFVPYRDAPGFLFQNDSVGRRYFHGAFVPSPHLDFFHATKPAGGLRVVFQGESSAAGFPYGHGGAPSRMLEQRLQTAFPGRSVEVINTALTAVSSYVLLDQAREIAALHPDAVLIYTGHNEYYGVLGAASAGAFGHSRAAVLAYLAVRRLRLAQLVERLVAAGASSLRGRVATDDPGTVMELMAGDRLVPLGSRRFDDGVAQFRANLDALLARYQAAHIPVFVGTLVSDERDQPPLGGGSDANAAYAAARDREAHGDTAAARALYREAKERDALRFRAPEALNAVIRDVARRRGATVVETQQAVERASPGGIPGHSLILEHLHPNVDGYFVIADAFYEALRAVRAFGPWPAPPAAERAAARAAVPVTPLDSLAALYRTDRLTSGWPFRPHGVRVPAIVDTLHPRTPLEALAQRLVNGQLSWAEATDRLRAEYERAGDADDAIRVARALASEYRYAAQPYLDAARVALAAGRPADALGFARAAYARRETAESAKLVATLTLRTGDVSAAVPYLERAEALAPQDRDVRGALAAARMLPRLEADRQRTPRDTAVLHRLALAYALAQQYAGARDALAALLAVAPGATDAQALLRELPPRELPR
ncbi:hypothetical protein J421_4457 [Gemmatirosa kalamazoonensis]|uniref:SGNH hydrolase-type esterase domain-containing protein n=1 Tax=Gemmatirosa kalamazoonensis TaxID=861299 RepID=W0RLM9_9BACT|nr:hypothetical protein J421_4457 [Gemmatirosa kalamazoonensis]